MITIGAQLQYEKSKKLRIGGPSSMPCKKDIQGEGICFTSEL